MAERLFGELLAPVASPRLLEQSRNGQVPALDAPGDLARHVLLEEDDPRTTSGFRVSWRRWLAGQDLALLEPRGWIYLNYTHQQVQGALAGQGIALARMPLVHDLIERGELVELFGGQRRLASEPAYFLIEMPLAIRRAELNECADWIRTEAARTRAALGEPATR